MEINSAFNSALQGVRNGMAGLNRDAAKIASKAQMEGKADPTGALVDSQVQRVQVEANAKVMSTADKMLGSLLNEKA